MRADSRQQAADSADKHDACFEAYLEDLGIDLSGENDHVNQMVRWFLDVYEQPEENTPRDDGEWMWIYGGPYLPNEEIELQFEQMPDQDRQRAIALVESVAFEWTLPPGTVSDSEPIYDDN